MRHFHWTLNTPLVFPYYAVGKVSYHSPFWQGIGYGDFASVSDMNSLSKGKFCGLSFGLVSLHLLPLLLVVLAQLVPDQEGLDSVRPAVVLFRGQVEFFNLDVLVKETLVSA